MIYTTAMCLQSTLWAKNVAIYTVTWRQLQLISTTGKLHYMRLQKNARMDGIGSSINGWKNFLWLHNTTWHG